MNILRSKKGAQKEKYKCGLLVRAKRLHTPGETTPGEQDIGRNDRNSIVQNRVSVTGSTELARDVEELMAQAKRTYILIIKVNNSSCFVCGIF